MAICRNCGHRSSEGDSRCLKCGVKLNVISFQEKRAELLQRNAEKLAKKGFSNSEDLEDKISGNLLLSMKKASFLSRLIATVVDGILILLPSVVAHFLIPLFGGIFVCAAYYITFTAFKGQTIGKMVMGIKVVSTDGLPMTFEKSSIRYLGYVLSCLTLGLGFLIAIWDKNNQCFHDKFAGTYVIEIDMLTTSVLKKRERKGK